MQEPKTRAELKTSDIEHGMVLLTLLIVRIGKALGIPGVFDGEWSELFQIFSGGGFSMRHRET